MKKLKIITGVLSAISALIMIAIPILSSNMQSFYKGQIDDFSKNAQELLDKNNYGFKLAKAKCSFIFLLLV